MGAKGDIKGGRYRGESGSYGNFFYFFFKFLVVISTNDSAMYADDP